MPHPRPAVHRLVAIVAPVLVLSGCASVVEVADRVQIDGVEDLRDDLVADGLTAGEADCMVAELETQTGDLAGAIEQSDGSASAFLERNELGFSRASVACLAIDDADADVMEAEFRRGFLDSFLEADPTRTKEQGTCVIDAMVAAGFEPSAEAAITPQLQLELPDIFAACDVEAEDVTVLTDDEAREAVVTTLVLTGTATQQQAECVYDELVGGGIDPRDALGTTVDNEVFFALEDAGIACGIPPLDVSTTPLDEVRALFVLGFSSDGATTRAEAECVFDEMLRRGIPVEDFAGSAFGPGAETAFFEAIEVCVAPPS